MHKLQGPLRIITFCSITTTLWSGFNPEFLGQAQQPARIASGQEVRQPQAKTKEEHKAYVVFYQENDVKNKIDMGNKFLAEFATSELKPNVILLMIQSAQGARDSKVVVDLGEKFLNDFPQHPSKPFVLQSLMMGSQDLNNFAKTLKYGEMLLQADPNNLSAFYTIPFILSERSITADPEGRKQELSRAEEIALQGLNIMRPEQLNEGPWNQYQASLHSSLGLIHLNNKEYPQAQAEYGKATTVVKDDPILYFRAGLAYSFDKKYQEAIDALSKSVYLKGITEIQAKTELERVYRIKNSVTSTGPELQAAIQRIVDEAGTKLK